MRTSTRHDFRKNKPKTGAHAHQQNQMNPPDISPIAAKINDQLWADAMRSHPQTDNTYCERLSGVGTATTHLTCSDAVKAVNELLAKLPPRTYRHHPTIWDEYGEWPTAVHRLLREGWIQYAYADAIKMMDVVGSYTSLVVSENGPSKFRFMDIPLRDLVEDMCMSSGELFLNHTPLVEQIGRRPFLYRIQDFI